MHLMKRLIILTILFCSTQILVAQDKFKFGDCPISLLEMTSYENDPEAEAVVIYEDRTQFYTVNNVSRDFEIITDYVVRIKILNQEGVEYANASIPFYKGKTTAASESITGLTGWTYNLENGKVVKEKLSKDYVFTEDVTEYRKRMKFALPAVKAGSVIEYKYRHQSPYYYSTQKHIFQRLIPVKESHFMIRIPEYFIFNRNFTGQEHIDIKVKPESQTFLFGGNRLNCSAEETTASVYDLPALDDEEYVWNYEDYLTAISLELQRVLITGVYQKDYTKNWNNVVTELNSNDSFGRELKKKNLLKEELSATLSEKTTTQDSIRAVLNLVREKVKWNNGVSLLIRNQNKALKDGTGNSGEINALLFNALQTAEFTVYPVALSLRSNGRLPISHPSIDNFNYFIVCVSVGGKNYLLDATRSYTDINVIPNDCMVEKALMIYPDSFQWIDLTNIGNNQERLAISLQMNEDGLLAGKRTSNYSGQLAYSFGRSYNNATSENDYIEGIETRNNIQISNFQVETKYSPNFGYNETYDFVLNDFRMDDEMISFSPLLFLAMRSNPFKSEERKLPVEFSFPRETRINVLLTIPEGYTIDEMPESQKLVYDDNSINLTYMIQQNGNLLQLSYRFQINTLIVPILNYQELRDFWSKLYNKENEVVILKKL